tara:strand:- start:8 stop:481 length:474 start_codon:yes stop_codon:yes gene_type:complete
MSDVTDYFEGGLNAEDIETSTYDKSPIPEGKYVGKIVNASAEINPESWSEGEHLKIEFEITSEQSKGRHCWKNITLVGKEEKYVDAGKKDLMRLMNAVGIGSLTKFDQLIGKEVGFTITISKKGYNNIKYWEVATETKPTQTEEKENSSDEKNEWDI